MDTEKKIPLCIHCRFYESEPLQQCSYGAKRVLSPVDGKPAWSRSLVMCENARRGIIPSVPCGPDGRLFEAEPEGVI